MDIIKYICNWFILYKYVPKFIKKRNIIPILKPNKSDNIVGHYRPISLINSLLKIYDMVIDIRLREYLIDLDLLNHKQFSYMKGKNGLDMVTYIQSKIKENNGKNKKTHVINWDASSAFDRINKDLLLKQLNKYYGINQEFINIIKSFLFERTSTVIINGYESDVTDDVLGSPQGGVTSALLFIVYLNPLLDQFEEKGIHYAELISYADDIFLIYTETIKLKKD